MKRTSIIFFLIAIFYSCEENNKRSISDLEEASLASGIRIDTLFDDFYFGKKREDLPNVGTDYKFKEKNLNRYNFKINPSFYNDSLRILRFVAYNFDNSYSLSKYSSFDPIVELFSLKYGNPDTVFSDISNSGKYYYSIWLKSNLEIEISYKDGSYQTLSIEYNDLSRTGYGRDMIRSTSEYGEAIDIYTKEYYDNVYLPKKKKEVESSEF